MPDARDAEDSRLLDAQDHPRLLATYYPLVLERCRLRIRDEGDASEVAHTVCVRLLAELRAGKRYPVPFRVVVHKVTTWTIGGFFAGERLDLLPEGWDTPDGSDPFAGVEEAADLEALFAPLPKRVREVLSLRYLEGLDPEETAARLGIERNAVDQAHHRGLAALRETLAAS
jgi:RNA polymerase sigma factor (sigma-70 family)